MTYAIAWYAVGTHVLNEVVDEQMPSLNRYILLYLFYKGAMEKRRRCFYGILAETKAAWDWEPTQLLGQKMQM